MERANGATVPALHEVVAEIFLTLAGTACVPAIGCSSDVRGLWARVNFGPPLLGSCTVGVDTESAAAFAGKLLGDAGGLGPEMLEDAVRELCNMIAGGWKSRLAAVWSGGAMSAPQLLQQDEATPAADSVCKCPLRYGYAFDSSRFFVELAPVWTNEG